MAFEYVVVKEEFEFKEDAEAEVLPVGENNEAECNKNNIKVEPNTTNNIRSVRTVVLRGRRVSYDQLECLWEFLNSHRDVAIGYNKSAQARDYTKRMWVSVSKTLNSLREGATKDWKRWSNYWIDYKAKLKRRVAALRGSQNHTGGAPAEVIPLSDIEKKFLSLLGEGFGSGLPTTQTQVHPFPNLTPPTPEAGQPQPGEEELSSYDGPLQESVVVKEEPQPESQQEEASTIKEEEPFAQPQMPAEPRRSYLQRRRRSRRPTAYSQQMARDALVEISRARLVAEQENGRSLSRIAEGLQQNQLLLQDVLGTLNRIATAIDSIKTEVLDPPSPDSSQTANTSWLVPIKEEVQDVHPVTFLQVNIEEEGESENDEGTLGGNLSDDSAIQQPPSLDDDDDYELDSKSGSFLCEICRKSFANSSNLQRHMLLHQNPFKCQQCDGQFLSKKLLKTHILSRHTIAGERAFSCDECPKTFKTSSNLQQHKKTHLVHKPYQCTKCSQTFAFKSNFKKHQTKPCPIAPSKDPLVCQFCDKVFEKEFLLKSHLRKHDTDRPFPCEECTMAFKHKSTLIRHMHVHSGIRPYACPHCGKTFTSSGLLKPHLRVHTGEKPYKCEVCQKNFAHKHNMQRHLVGHEKVKHTVCDICHKEFPRESRLRYHMKTHVNEKFFICKVCPKRFSHKQNVIRHYSRKHPGKTYSCEETDASVAAKVWDTVKKRFDDEETEEILG